MFANGLSSFSVHSITSAPINYEVLGFTVCFLMDQISSVKEPLPMATPAISSSNFITLPVCQNGWLYANLRSGPILAAFIHSLLQRGRRFLPEFYFKSETKMLSFL